MAGEAQWFAAEYNHAERGHLTTQADYIPNRGADGTVMGLTIIVQDGVIEHVFYPVYPPETHIVDVTRWLSSRRW